MRLRFLIVALGAFLGAELARGVDAEPVHQLAPDEFGGAFGHAVAISDGFLVVGAPRDTEFGEFAGAVYVFDAKLGTPLHKLSPDDVAPGMFFGIAVDMHDGVIVIGALNDTINGQSVGSAYLFDAETGEQLGKLIAGDGRPGDQFASRVAIHGDVVVVGAHQDVHNGVRSGSVYRYDRTTMAQVQKITPSDARDHQLFGIGLATDGARVLVGSPGNDAAYLFDLSVGSQKKYSDGIPLLTSFGESVALFGNHVIIGNPTMVTPFGSGSGSVIVFDRTNNLPGVQLFNNDARSHSARFGGVVAARDGMLAVSAIGVLPYGAVYLYDLGSLEQVGKRTIGPEQSLIGNDPIFGFDVDVEGSRLLVGAAGPPAINVLPGVSYVFDTSPCQTADVNGDGIVNAADLGAVITHFGETDSFADVNGDGEVEPVDLQVLISVFGESCN